MGTLGFKQRALWPNSVCFGDSFHLPALRNGVCLFCQSPRSIRRKIARSGSVISRAVTVKAEKLSMASLRLLRGQGNFWLNVWILIHGLPPPQSMYTLNTAGLLVTTRWVLMGPFLSLMPFSKTHLKKCGKDWFLKVLSTVKLDAPLLTWVESVFQGVWYSITL